MKQNFDVAAYIWPSYADDPRSRIFWEKGFGEWQSVLARKQKFPDQELAPFPQWGFVNEADPYVMQMQIEAALDHGVNCFIYDWYWYDNRPFLEGCLTDGFLKAKNNNKMKFYLMWANHDVNHLWDIRNADENPGVIWQAGVNRSQFEYMAERIIDKFLVHPSYYRIDNKPVFALYHLETLIKGLGSLKQTAAALKWMNTKAVSYGLEGIHFQLISRQSRKDLAGTGEGGGRTATEAEAIQALGIHSLTHYQWVHITDVNRNYPDVLEDVVSVWENLDQSHNIDYFPHVSIGWDNNLRFNEFRPTILKENTPENVEAALIKARKYLEKRSDMVPLCTINSWNEWTEASYLQPDKKYGYGYLEAVKRVFCGE